jgi:hypothetical protein
MWVRPGAYLLQRGNIICSTQISSSLTNIRLEWKNAGDETLAFFRELVSDEEKLMAIMLQNAFSSSLTKQGNKLECLSLARF